MFQINQRFIPDFTKPLDLLVHCHENIERQLEALARAAEVLRVGDSLNTAQAFAAIDAACKHFAVAGIRHTADEEESLFPRLRKSETSAGDEALAAMSELESQHRTAEDMHRQFDEFVLSLPRDGSADTRELDSFGEMTAELAAFYRPHIFMENNLVFPIAGRILSDGEIHAQGEEMRERWKDILQKINATAANVSPLPG